MVPEKPYLASWTWDLRTNTVTGSKEMFSLCGLVDTDPEIRFDQFFELVHPEDRKILQDGFETVRNRHSKTAFNYRILCPDGTVRLIHTEAEAVLDDNNKPCKIFGIDQDITEQVQAEQELQENKEKYQRLFHAIDEGFCIVEMFFDTEGKPVDFCFLETNPAFEKNTGLQGVEGKRIRHLIPELEDRWLEAYGHVILTGEPVRFENKVKALNRWFDVYVFRFGEKEERKLGVLFKDITERRQAVESLQKSENQLRSMFDFASVGIVQVNVINGQFIWFNRKYREITGYSDAELRTKSFSELTHPEDRKQDWELFQRAVRGETSSYHNEKRYIRKDGSIVWVRLNAALIRDESGRFKRTVAVCEDITERKRMEQKLQQNNDELEQKVQERTSELAQANELLQQEINERKQAQKALEDSEARYRTLVNNATEAIIVVQDDLIKFANPMTEMIFGCSLEKIKTTFFTEFIQADDRHLILERHKKRLEGEKVESPFIFRLEAGDGKTKWISKTSDIIEWEGQPAILGIMADITEQKVLEEKMFKEDKLDSIGILAGGIAHDFNNYLATLLGNINLAKLYKDDMTKVLDKLENMENVTMRAKELSNQLFTFAKGGTPVKERISIIQLIVEDIKFTLSGTPIRPIFQIAEDLHTVEADEGQISQVLNNIAINAVQAMPEGGILEISAENVTLESTGPNSMLSLTEGLYVQISIKDKGVGIPENLLSKIFDPFFTTKEKGRGLGLATVYSIVKNHGGSIHVESETGKGTTFCIYLPAITESDMGLELRDDIIKGSGKILVMDDEEDLLTVTGEALSALGYEACFAKDGKEAVKRYMYARNNARPFDLVIMDLTIPGGMGGKQAIKELLKQAPEAKVIVASGYSNDPVMANYQDYGFKGMIKKPFAIGELSRVVHATISC